MMKHADKPSNISTYTVLEGNTFYYTRALKLFVSVPTLKLTFSKGNNTTQQRHEIQSPALAPTACDVKQTITLF